jgi:hypothetical protein
MERGMRRSGGSFTILESIRGRASNTSLSNLSDQYSGVSKLQFIQACGVVLVFLRDPIIVDRQLFPSPYLG